MDVMQREELERLMFFEQTREKAAADYARSPNDPDVSMVCLFGYPSSLSHLASNLLLPTLMINTDRHRSSKSCRALEAFSLVFTVGF
jgi:hypothetical protein